MRCPNQGSESPVLSGELGSGSGAASILGQEGGLGWGRKARQGGGAEVGIWHIRGAGTWSR